MADDAERAINLYQMPMDQGVLKSLQEKGQGWLIAEVLALAMILRDALIRENRTDDKIGDINLVSETNRRHVANVSDSLKRDIHSLSVAVAKSSDDTGDKLYDLHGRLEAVEVLAKRAHDRIDSETARARDRDADALCSDANDNEDCEPERVTFPSQEGAMVENPTAASLRAASKRIAELEMLVDAKSKAITILTEDRAAFQKGLAAELGLEAEAPTFAVINRVAEQRRALAKVRKAQADIVISLAKALGLKAPTAMAGMLDLVEVHRERIVELSERRRELHSIIANIARTALVLEGDHNTPATPTPSQTLERVIKLAEHVRQMESEHEAQRARVKGAIANALGIPAPIGIAEMADMIAGLRTELLELRAKSEAERVRLAEIAKLLGRV